MNNIVSNREIAVVIWTSLFLIWAIPHINIRKLLGSIPRAFFKRIVVLIVLMTLYISLIVLLFYNVGFWKTSQLKDSILWFLGIAFVMFMHMNEVSKDEHYFRNVLLDSVKLTLVLEFIVNFYVFALWIELILVPVLTFVVMMKTFAETDPTYRRANSVLRALLVVVGICALAYAFNQISVDLRGFATFGTLHDFLLPLALTIAFLPFVYGIALYSTYEQVYLRLRLFNKNSNLIRYAMRRILVEFRLDLYKLTRWSGRVGALRVTCRDEVEALIARGRDR